MSKEMGFLRKRWLEFRTGNGAYVAMFLSVVSFMLIVHRLLIERVPILGQIFGDLLSFSLIFLAFFVPICILIGRWHYKYQYKVESTVQFFRNPALAKALRLLIELEQKKSNPEDIENFKKLLLDIEKSSDFSELGKGNP